MKQVFIFCWFIALAFETNAQSSGWTSVAGGPTGSSVRRVRLDASGNLLVYSGSDGKIYKSIDGGTNWTIPTTPSGYIEDFEIDGTKLLLLQWNNLYASTDGGGSWTKTNSASFDNGQEITKVPGVNGYLIVGDQGARISLDAGVTWKKIYNGGSEHVAVSSAGDIYIADPNVGIVKHPTQSSLAGWDVSHWQTIYPKEYANSDFALSVGVNPAASNKVYITYRKADNTGTLFKSSTDGGTTWTVVTPPISDAQGNLWFSFTTDSKFYFVSGNAIYDVADGTSPTFSLKQSPGYSYYWIRDLFYKGNNEVYSGVDGDGVWKSNDGLITWTDISGSTQSNGIAVPPGRDLEMVGLNLLYLKDYGAKAYWYTSNNGSTFTRKDLGFSFLAPATGKILKKIQTGAVIASTSQGTQLTSDGINWGQLSATAFADYVTVGTSDIYGFSNNGLIKKSQITNSVPSDFTTTVTPTGLPASYTVNDVTYNNGYFFMAITNNSVSPSQQQYWKLNAASFAATQLTSSLSTQPGSLSGIFVMNTKLYIGDRQQIAISSDQGASFVYLSYNHQHILPVLQNGNALGVSNVGTFATTKDDGKTWSSNAVPNDQVIVQNIYSPSAALSFAAAYNAPMLKSDSIVRVATSPFIDFGWTKLNGPYGGGGRKLFKNTSGVLFAESFFSAHRYNNTTSSWETLESVSMNNHALYVDASGAIYHCTGNEIFKSTDAGNTFTKLTGTFNSLPNGGGFFKDASNNLYVLTSNGIYRSTDDGASFNVPATASSGSYYEMTQSGSTLLVSKIDNGVMTLLRSTDNGSTWSPVSGITFPNANRIQNVISSTSNAFVVVASDNIYKSSDGGITWSSIKSNISETSFSDYGSLMFYGAAGEYYFYMVGYPGKIYISTDQGSTWSVKASATTNRLSDIRSFVWSGTRLFAYSIYQGISYSDDGGVTFASFQNDKGLTNYTGEVKAIDGALLFASGNELLSSTDQGSTWNKISSEGVGNFLDLQNGDLLSYRNSIIKSTDRGLTWNVLKASGDYIRFIVQTSNGYIAHGRINSGSDGQFFTSSDLINWSVIVPSGLPTSFTIYGNSMAALGDQVFVTFYNSVTSRNELYKISSGSATQVIIANDPRTVVSSNGKLLLFSYEGTLYETLNGTSWTKRATPAGDNFIIANNGYLFITANNGIVWVSRDNGVSWQNVSASNFAAAFTNISIDLSSGYAYGTARERGVLKSANVIMPNDNTPPAVVSLLPANNAVNIALSGLKLTLTFDEVPKKVTGKKIGLYNLASPSTALETYDAGRGVVAGNSVSFVPSVTLSDLKTYYLTVEAGAFTDIFGNPFAGIISSSDWRFTTLDATPPVISFTTSNLDKGVAKDFSINATDNQALAEDKIKIFYRGVSTLPTTSFQSASLTVTQGTGTSAITAKTAVNESWYDGMGLEFYFQAEDLSGNKTRLPADTSYFYSYINYPSASKPKITGLAFGGTPTSYKVISIPFELADNKASTIFDELGGSNKSVWRFLTYAGDNSWNDIADGSLTTIERGKGYWINIKNFTEVFVEGASTPANNRNNFFTINLNPGWNQIGNPYPVSISWEETISGKTGIGKIKVYNNGTYSNGDVLGPFEGGFVYVTGGAQALKVRFQGIFTGGRIGNTNHNIDLPAWELPITIVQGDIKNELSGIGMNPDAIQGIDSFDDPALPVFPGVPHTSLLFGNTMKLNKDVVNTQESYVWNFNPSTSQAGETLLQWKNDDLKNSGKDLFLFDLKRQVLVDMKEHNQYAFNPEESKNFQIHFGANLAGKIKPTSSVIGSMYPNPAHSTLNIPITVDELNAGASVAVNIFDHTGNLAQSLHLQNIEPGFYTLQNQLDSSLQNGLYIVKVAITTPNGVQSHTTKLILNR